MALRASFEQNNIGLPVPDCYIKIETVFFDSLNQIMRLGVVFYVNEAQRLNDIRERRKQVESQLESKKSEVILEQSKESIDIEKLEVLTKQQQALQETLEAVTGEAPFYAKVFEFPATGTEPENILSLGYQKLKSVNFSGVEDGKLITLDFTKAVDV